MKKNNPNATITDLQINHISTSRKTGLGMYTITFKIGKKPYSQTRHMSSGQASIFIPTIPIVQSGGRVLQKSSYAIATAKTSHTTLSSSKQAMLDNRGPNGKKYTGPDSDLQSYAQRMLNIT